MSCYTFNCKCFYCSRVQYGCKRDTPKRCADCIHDFKCSQPLPKNYYNTKCVDFGSPDGMNGSCHYCKEESKDLFNACLDVGYLSPKPSK